MNGATLSQAEIASALDGLPNWHYADGAITRTWRTAGWKATLMAVNAVGHLAELAWHHPDIKATFGAVEVRLTTHDAGGVTAKDFALARKIDALLDWRPGVDEEALAGPPPSDRTAAYFKNA